MASSGSDDDSSSSTSSSEDEHQQQPSKKQKVDVPPPLEVAPTADAAAASIRSQANANSLLTGSKSDSKRLIVLLDQARLETIKKASNDLYNDAMAERVRMEAIVDSHKARTAPGGDESAIGGSEVP